MRSAGTIGYLRMIQQNAINVKRKMNTRKKGQLAERRAVQELRDKGYLVYRVKGSTRWNKEVDIFSLFDIYAIKNLIYAHHGRTLINRKYIQVKHRKPTLTKFKKFKEEYCAEDDDVEIWVWKGRKGFDKTIIKGRKKIKNEENNH